MSQVFLSWTTLCSEDIDLTGMKTASLFFDQLVLEVARQDAVDLVLDGLVRDQKLTRDTAGHLRRIWVPIQAVLPAVDGMNILSWGDAELEKIALQATLNYYRDDLHVDASAPGFPHEAAWAWRGFVAAVAKWGLLNAQQGCTFLANLPESRIVQAAFQQRQPSEATRAFQEILHSRVPDVRSLPWERVFELRSHPFLENFRKKVTELVSTHRSIAERTVAEAVREIELYDLRELARLVEPSPRRTILRSIASNLPMPLPINPASLGIAVKEIGEAYERRERFGWLYFLMELSTQ